MAIVNNGITWNELISTAKNNLLSNIENLEGNSIPSFLTMNERQVSAAGPYGAYARGLDQWTTVSRDEVLQDFDAFLTERGLMNRTDQLVSTRLIINFFENLAQYYSNRLVFISSPFTGENPVLYFNNKNKTPFSTWSNSPSNVELQYRPDVDQIKSTEVGPMIERLGANLKNKANIFSQKYSFRNTSCSCSCSSSCCSCWTIVHQDLSLL